MSDIIMPGILYDLQGPILRRRTITTDFASGGGWAGNRGAILRFSPRAGARMRRYLRTCAAEYRVFVTLTYPSEFPLDGRECKRQLRAFLARYRRASSDPAKFSAFWFLEFQHRGAPHFHIFGTDFVDHADVAQWWYDIVGSNDERHLRAGTSIESIRSGRHGTSAYASKYAAKAEQKEIPANFLNCGRFWGIEGLRRCLVASIFVDISAINSPEHVVFRQELRDILQKYRRNIKILRLHGFSSGVYLKTDEAQREIKMLFARWGCIFTTKGLGTYEDPTLDCEQLTVEPFSTA